MLRRLARYALPAALALCSAAFVLQASQAIDIFPFVNTLQQQFYDAQLISHGFENSGEDKSKLNVVIVDVDERSLYEVGRWPWPRAKLAKITDNLFAEYGIKALGFDVIFTEEQGVESKQALLAISDGIPDSMARLDRLWPELDNDAIFAKAIQNRPVVLGSASMGPMAGQMAKEAGLANVGEASAAGCSLETFPDLPLIDSFLGNNPKIARFALSSGYFGVLPDNDGKVRRITQLVRWRDNNGREHCEASLSLALARAALGAASPIPAQSPDGLNKYLRLALPARLGEPPRSIDIPVNSRYETFIPYRGPDKSFEYISAADVLSLKADKKKLAGKIVLFGTGAQGLRDLRSTPVAADYPGVEAHANLVEAAIDGTMLSKPSGTSALLVLLTALVAAGSAYSSLRLKALTGTLFCAMLASVCLGISEYAWSCHHLIFPVAASLAAIAANWCLGMTFGYIFETRIRKKMTDLFGQYVPPELVKIMTKNPDGYNMRGAKKELTVLFSDVRDFTAISENMKADELADMIGAYLGDMTECVRKCNGTLDKYIGDALMAFWGAPVSDERHAYNAVCSALLMLTRLDSLNQAFEAKGWPRLKIGIGINTGTMSVGDMGTSARRAYTVMGDAVNVGSRLESATKDLGVPILVGERTWELTRKHIAYDDLGIITVKGKQEPLRVFAPLKILGRPPLSKAPGETQKRPGPQPAKKSKSLGN